jgi:hypothetical protein
MMGFPSNTREKAEMTIHSACSTAQALRQLLSALPFRCTDIL